MTGREVMWPGGAELIKYSKMLGSSAATTSKRFQSIAKRPTVETGVSLVGKTTGRCHDDSVWPFQISQNPFRSALEDC